MRQPTTRPTRKVTAAAGGGVVATTGALIALGLHPLAALGGAIATVLLGLIPAYFLEDHDPRS
jgi:hypothetical protein